MSLNSEIINSIFRYAFLFLIRCGTERFSIHLTPFVHSLHLGFVAGWLLLLGGHYPDSQLWSSFYCWLGGWAVGRIYGFSRHCEY